MMDLEGGDCYMFVYTPESVGGTIIYEHPTGKYHTQDLFIGNTFVHISQNQDNGHIVIEVHENTKTIKVISSIELNFQKHKTDNYFGVFRKE
jgi:hypothetical protein